MFENTAIITTAENTIKQNRYLRVIELYAGQGGLIAGFNRVSDWQHFLAVEIIEKHCNVLKQIFPNLTVLQ